MKKSSILTILAASSLFLAACNNDADDTATNGGPNNNNNEMSNEEMNDDNGDGHGDHGGHGDNNNENEENHHNDHDGNHHENNDENDHHGHGGEGAGDREDIEAEAATGPESINENATDGLMVENTKNVTRIGEDDPITFSILASQTIWPATHEGNQPGTVILGPLDSWQHSLAALTLVHHPNDGPLLYTEGSISDEVLQEIERLQPLGNSEGIQVMVMEDFPEEEMDKLSEFEVETISADDPAEFAAKIDERYAEIVGSLPGSVIIGSAEEEAQLMTMVAGDWISHMDEPVLYVNEFSIPEATVDALEKRNGEANIYLLGSEAEVSATIEEELSEYGTVTRISGETPVELSIAFASFYDEETGFGWDITEPGHGITFASTETPELALPGAPLAHLGKHAPMIWLSEGELNQKVYDYLAKLKPAFEEVPTEGPYNHGYVFGSTDSISFSVQGIIDEKMEIVSISGDDHGGHGH